MNNYIKSVLRNISSALRYQTVTFADGEYRVTTPFKGLHITNSGEVEIEGVDGETVVLTLTPGCWPYGGSAIIENGTSSTNIVALY
jgi:hypothetical protein